MASAPASARDAETLTPVHPNYRTVLRLTIALIALPFLVGASIFEIVRPFDDAVPMGILVGPILAIAALFVWRWPKRRYNARGYDLGRDRLRVARGVWWRSDTIVPFGRVQHIDVDRGPLERAFGLSTIVLHTAGNHNASVSLPGLLDEDALAMREEIRAHIKRDTL
jgi:hypothetical protein